MNSVPPGEIMGQVHIADQSDKKAPETKGIDAWKGYPANQFFKATTIMSLTLRYPSIDHLQAN